jgi:SAM-dependent methyltransferase
LRSHNPIKLQEARRIQHNDLRIRALNATVARRAPEEHRSDMANAIEWSSVDGGDRVAVECPNCANTDGKRTILRTPWPGDPIEAGWAMLVDCSNCGCGFFHPMKRPDHGADPVGGEGALAFYLQQGAGLWSITSNLNVLDKPVGTRFLEVGCGYGFGLDFARRILGWDIVGVDPSPLAAAGRAALKLPIETRNLVANDPLACRQFDVVMASEVIEHVPSPLAFARTLRDALRDSGTLVITTPDVEAVRPDTPSGLLVPLLSVGHHLVLQSKRSLTTLLREAGFEKVEVQRIGDASLVGLCCFGSTEATSSSPRPSTHDDRRLYRRYLGDAAAVAKLDSDLWLGLTVREYREAVSAADSLTAAALWNDLSEACRRRFGFAPEAAAEVIHTGAGETLHVLAEREPLCLGPILLYRALHRLLIGEPRSSVETLFRSAADACGRLRRSLLDIGSDDGDAEDVSWVAEAEGLLCNAERGEADVPNRLAALGPAPGDVNRPSGHRRIDSYRRRCFVSLVNSARLDDADQLADVVAQVEKRGASRCPLMTDDELDVLFCAAARELQRLEPAAARALDLLQQLRSASATSASAIGSAVKLIAPARDAESLALDLLTQQTESRTEHEGK